MSQMVKLKTINKWFSSIQAAIEDEIQRLTSHLTGRVKVLEVRYARRLSDLQSEVKTMSAKVEAHLQKMKIDWT